RNHDPELRAGRIGAIQLMHAPLPASRHRAARCILETHAPRELEWVRAGVAADHLNGAAAELLEVIVAHPEEARVVLAAAAGLHHLEPPPVFRVVVRHHDGAPAAPASSTTTRMAIRAPRFPQLLVAGPGAGRVRYDYDGISFRDALLGHSSLRGVALVEQPPHDC